MLLVFKIAQSLQCILKGKRNIEGAPWTGGYFECLILSIKWYLKKVLGNARLDHEQMLPIIKEVETVFNKRAITYLYNENDLVERITPNKLLFGRNTLHVNTGHFDAIAHETSSTKWYKRTSILLEYFWKRWREEYIIELREFNKIKNLHEILVKPNINDVVLIEDKN